jgi:glutamate--cysteine ligase
MTDNSPAIDEAAAQMHGICLKTGPPRQIGVELEWLVRDARDPSLPVTVERVAATAEAFGATLDSLDGSTVLDNGSSLTVEPGGQLELSSAPAPSLAQSVAFMAADLAALREAAAAQGLELAGYGLDPLRPPRRVLDKPRYAAMEAFFDRGGPWGRQMMCGSASVQVCLDSGRDDGDGTDGYRWRWRLAHALGPVLVAAFANSPMREGRPTGWRSSRQQVWLNIDPGRTRPVLDGAGLDGDPRDAWAAYALAAEVMCVPHPESADWTAPPGLTLSDWIASGQPRTVSPDDVPYHLTTLFPPVRPRGYLELRMIDAQPGDGWIVPLAVATAIFADPEASRAAMEATAHLTAQADRWEIAARRGPADAGVARASRECFAAAIAALSRAGAPGHVRDAVGEFHERYVCKDRCPADDLLEDFT